LASGVVVALGLHQKSAKQASSCCGNDSTCCPAGTTDSDCCE
jgi:hypothetical protein